MLLLLLHSRNDVTLLIKFNNCLECVSLLRNWITHTAHCAYAPLEALPHDRRRVLCLWQQDHQSSPVQSTIVQSNDSKLSWLGIKTNSIWMPKNISLLCFYRRLFMAFCGSFGYDSLDMQNIYFGVGELIRSPGANWRLHPATANENCLPWNWLRWRWTPVWGWGFRNVANWRGLCLHFGWRHGITFSRRMGTSANLICKLAIARRKCRSCCRPRNASGVN